MAHNHLEPVGETNGHGHRKLNFSLMILIKFQFHVCNLRDKIWRPYLASFWWGLEKMGGIIEGTIWRVCG